MLRRDDRQMQINLSPGGGEGGYLSAGFSTEDEPGAPPARCRDGPTLSESLFSVKDLNFLAPAGDPLDPFGPLAGKVRDQLEYFEIKFSMLAVQESTTLTEEEKQQQIAQLRQAAWEVHRQSFENHLLEQAQRQLRGEIAIIEDSENLTDHQKKVAVAELLRGGVLRECVWDGHRAPKGRIFSTWIMIGCRPRCSADSCSMSMRTTPTAPCGCPTRRRRPAGDTWRSVERTSRG